MIVNAPDMMQGYPMDAKPDTTKPYVMYANTPYAHLMISGGITAPGAAGARVHLPARRHIRNRPKPVAGRCRRADKIAPDWVCKGDTLLLAFVAGESLGACEWESPPNGCKQ